MATWRTPEDLEEVQATYKIKLKEMDDEALRHEAGDKIWLSAYANNNLRSDYHWQVDMVNDECKARDRVNIYQEEWQKLYDEARGMKHGHQTENAYNQGNPGSPGA